ncbi:hypothetical protein F4815DRAFT_464877 [Daldinia loculata]|nr:hypothetical protein F4815DRAFT_464877 [Daldinia loculata]
MTIIDPLLLVIMVLPLCRGDGGGNKSEEKLRLTSRVAKLASPGYKRQNICTQCECCESPVRATPAQPQWHQSTHPMPCRNGAK